MTQTVVAGNIVVAVEVVIGTELENLMYALAGAADQIGNLVEVQRILVEASPVQKELFLVGTYQLDEDLGSS